MTTRRSKAGSAAPNTRKRPEAALVGRKSRSSSNSLDVPMTIEQERDALRFELDTARERIADLERRQKEISRRLSAILKSLQTLRAEED
jgi:chromosome segregation ATPase